MSEFNETGFTGERVIPELVDSDLLNEHLARYRFAGRLIREIIAQTGGKLRVLDAGCGSGYGAAELGQAASQAASVTAADISAEAIGYARAKFAASGVRFLRATCERLPFAPAVFDMVTAFEVIEHLTGWQEMLAEAGRVLKPSGVLLVSTPNRNYYDESRGDAGPNPFHVHEFDYEEFRTALGAVFPHVRIWTQNHAETIVFSPDNPNNAALEAAGAADPANAHFYLALCSQSPIAANEVFAWLPSGGNVLRERERHIAKLNGELAKKDAWLAENIEAQERLQHNHEELIAELERQNKWAVSRDLDVKTRDARICELQDELEERYTWVTSLQAEIAAGQTELARLQERDAELARIHASKWFRVRKKLGLAPDGRDEK